MTYMYLPSKPIVSVLMSVFNGERYLREAVESILNQTFTDFELIIVNDASTDNTSHILTSFHDSRLIVMNNEANVGLTKSLNRGLKLCRGKYVARMDSDDVSELNRLSTQVDFLEHNPDIDVLGTCMTRINEDGLIIGELDYHHDPVVNSWIMIWTCPVAHPSVMIRKEIVHKLGGYDPKFLVAQDYDLWIRILQAGGKISVFPERLLRYRSSNSQIGHNHYLAQQQNALDISCRHISWLIREAIDRHVAEDVIRLVRAEKVYEIRNIFQYILVVDWIVRRCRNLFNDQANTLTRYISKYMESKAKIAFPKGLLIQSLVCYLYSIYIWPLKLMQISTYTSLLKSLSRILYYSYIRTFEIYKSSGKASMR